MLAEHERRFARIVSNYLERPAGDYAELLHRGHVSSPGRRRPRGMASGDPRAGAPREDPRDHPCDGEGAIAALNRTVGDQVVRDELERANVLRRLAAAARALGHEPGHWLRSDQESVCS